MALHDLTNLEILQGVFGLIWVIFAIFIGILLIWKAISLNRNDLALVGLTYILITSAWWGVALQFITYGFFDYRLTSFQYLLVANIFIPLAITIWIYAFCQIFNPNLKKSLLIVYVIINVIWVIYMIVALSIDVEWIGTLEGIFDSTQNRIQLIFVMFSIFSFLVTGLIFSIKSMKAENPEIKWKGRFLTLAWILFTLGALLDAALPLTEITLILVRLILIISSILFYMGFFMPEKISKWLIK